MLTLPVIASGPISIPAKELKEMRLLSLKRTMRGLHMLQTYFTHFTVLRGRMASHGSPLLLLSTVSLVLDLVDLVNEISEFACYIHLHLRLVSC